MAREGARLGHFGNLKVYMNPPNFVQEQLHMDTVGMEYRRKIATSESYAGRDVIYGHFDIVLYNYKD